MFASHRLQMVASVCRSRGIGPWSFQNGPSDRAPWEDNPSAQNLRAPVGSHDECWEPQPGSVWNTDQLGRSDSFAKNRWNRRACESGMVVMMVVMMMMMVPPYFCLSAKFCRARCCAWGIAGWGSPLRYGPFGLWLQDPGHFTDQHEQYVSLAPLQKPGGLECLGWTRVWTGCSMCVLLLSFAQTTGSVAA